MVFGGRVWFIQNGDNYSFFRESCPDVPDTVLPFDILFDVGISVNLLFRTVFGVSYNLKKELYIKIKEVHLSYADA